MRRRTALVGIGTLSVAALEACSDDHSNITGPSGDAQPVNVLSGRTDQPVPSLGGLTARAGETLRLQAPGFFGRTTAFTGAPVLLWPADDGFLSSHHTRAVVYNGADPGTLKRLPTSVTAISLVPDSNIRSFAWALESVEKAAATLSLAHPALEFTVDGAGFVVPITVNLADKGFQDNPGAAGLAYRETAGDGEITGARIVFRTLQLQGFWYTKENFEVAVAHEVLHTTGLEHSADEDPAGMMAGNAKSYSFRTPTGQEMLIMKMQYDRPPGTTLAGMTESDPGVSAKSSKSEWHLVCAR